MAGSSSSRRRNQKISSRPARDESDEPTVKGCVLYRGRSPFVTDGDDQYAVILTFQSDNRKTGDMAQIWLIAENESPLEARKLGLHRIVCGDCAVVKLCYVNLAQRPRTLYAAYKRGDYPDYDSSAHDYVVAANGVRFGAYGDPVLLPIWLVRHFVELSGGRYTGYTHQWRRPEFQIYRPYFMASCETLADVQLAESMGWRWYMVTTEDSVPGAVLCPHQNTALQQLVLCNTCWACNGAKDRPVGAPQRRSIIARPTGYAHAPARWNNSLGHTDGR